MSYAAINHALHQLKVARQTVSDVTALTIFQTLLDQDKLTVRFLVQDEWTCQRHLSWVCQRCQTRGAATVSDAALLVDFSFYTFAASCRCVCRDHDPELVELGLTDLGGEA